MIEYSRLTPADRNRVADRANLRMVALVALTVIVLAALLNAGSARAEQCTGAAPPSIGRALKIHEDDPRWNCHTMGNRVCGTPQSIGSRVRGAR